jgi:hypothetical protein
MMTGLALTFTNLSLVDPVDQLMQELADGVNRSDEILRLVVRLWNIGFWFLMSRWNIGFWIMATVFSMDAPA